MKSLAPSSFFLKGFYKKARACPYRFVDGKWSIDESIEACNIPVSAASPVIVEQKFNGNRGIFEFKDGKGCLHSASKGCHGKGFPAKIARLIEHQFSVANAAGDGIHDAVLDGEMYLEDCNGKIPGLAKQARAIKGSNPDIERDCTFSYKVFDIISLNGKDVTRQPLSKRKELLSRVIPYSFMDSSKGIVVDRVDGRIARSKAEIAAVATVLVSKGYEGIVVKHPGSKYDWKGKTVDAPSVDGWWKVKNASDVVLEATHACLGNTGKTGLNAFRYKTFQLGACKDDDCKELVTVTDKGVSHSVPGSDVSGLDKWDTELHGRVIAALQSGRGKPSRDARLVDDVIKETGLPPGSFDGLVQGITVDGKPGLPRCVSLPRGEIVVSAVSLEFNVNDKGIPKINGPPRLQAVIPGGKATTIPGIMKLASVHV